MTTLSRSFVPPALARYVLSAHQDLVNQLVAENIITQNGVDLLLEIAKKTASSIIDEDRAGKRGVERFLSFYDQGLIDEDDKKSLKLDQALDTIKARSSDVALSIDLLNHCQKLDETYLGEMGADLGFFYQSLIGGI